MTLQRTTPGRTATAFIVIVVVIAGALALASTYYIPPFQQASTNSTIRTCTNIPAISFLYCGSPLRISAYGEPGASPVGNSSYEGSWNFTASINSNSIARGESILLVASLTNIGLNQTIKEFVKPYINPAVYDTNGTEVWAWNPPQSTWPNVTAASGDTISQNVTIPTSQLQPGQSYFVKVAPLFLQFPSPNNMTFTFEFFIVSTDFPLSGTSTCYSGPLLSNSSSTTRIISVYDVAAQFNSWQWNRTSFSVGGYQIGAFH